MSEVPAVIFDMDGVLVDTYQAHLESWRIVAKKFGREMSEQDFASTFGRTSRETIATLWSSGGYCDDEIRVMDDHKEAAFREIIAADFPAMPGVGELLDTLHAAGFRLGAGSSAPPDNVNLVLDRLERRTFFSAIVTGTDVTRGKPDPQVFLMAAERLDVPPECCVVVEDAPVGIAAAKAAGMMSIGLASTGRTHEELADADRVVDRLCDISVDDLRRRLVQ